METIDDIRKRIQFNIDTLKNKKMYKYDYLCRALKGDNRLAVRPKELLYKILHYIADKELIYDYDLNTHIFYLDTRTISKLMFDSTYSKSNRYINYLCAIGVIKKVNQPIVPIKDFRNFYREIEHYNPITKRFLENNIFNSIPINFFYLPEYTNEYLQEIEQRAKKIIDVRLTPGETWSSDTLIAKGLKDIDVELYPHNHSALKRKKELLNYILSFIDYSIDIKGYATKEDIYNNVSLSNSMINKILRIFSEQIKTEYIYRRPTKEDVKNFQLVGNYYIFLKRGE